MIRTDFISGQRFTRLAVVAVGMLMLMLPATPALAQVAGIPAFNISEGEGGATYSLSLQILALMTALTLLPSLVLGMTSFTRIIIVLSILRQAMGTQQTPPNQVLVAIAVFLTLFIMAPTFSTLNTDVISPYLDGQLPADMALANGAEVMKRFLVQNTRINDLVMFTEMMGDQPYASPEEVPLNVLLPA
ncbi:MAG: flagellar biosynthetic protein FliP, partial [Candidatus Puniceispirillaceae bacterium]